MKVMIKSLEESNQLSGVWGGDLYDVTLEYNDEGVQATGVSYPDLSEDRQEELLTVFQEWYELAEMGEDGYEIL